MEQWDLREMVWDSDNNPGAGSAAGGAWEHSERKCDGPEHPSDGSSGSSASDAKHLFGLDLDEMEAELAEIISSSEEGADFLDAPMGVTWQLRAKPVRDVDKLLDCAVNAIEDDDDRAMVRNHINQLRHSKMEVDSNCQVAIEERADASNSKKRSNELEDDTICEKVQYEVINPKSNNGFVVIGEVFYARAKDKRGDSGPWQRKGVNAGQKIAWRITSDTQPAVLVGGTRATVVKVPGETRTYVVTATPGKVTSKMQVCINGQVEEFELPLCAHKSKGSPRQRLYVSKWEGIFPTQEKEKKVKVQASDDS
jgi:hypothetical protein